MSVSSILIILIVILIIYYTIRYFWYSNSVLVKSVNDATVSQTIDSSSLVQSTSGSTSANFTYSIWIYISDWSYNYGQEKIIFGRSGENFSGSVTTPTSVLSPSPLVMLGSSENNLIVSQEVYNTTSQTKVKSNTPTSRFTCGISNVPIQKWVNILMSVYGRSMDLYLDGKLVRTCVMPGIAKVSSTTPIYLTPNGGFSGYTSKFEYWPNATNPQMAWNIYARGYTNDWSLFSSDYSVEITVYNGNIKENSIKI